MYCIHASYHEHLFVFVDTWSLDGDKIREIQFFFQFLFECIIDTYVVKLWVDICKGLFYILLYIDCPFPHFLVTKSFVIVSNELELVHHHHRRHHPLAS